MTGWRTTLGAAVLAAVVGLPGVARAGLWEDAGWGVLSVLSNVGYMPAKFLYATAGSITGGFAWVLTGGDTEVADGIWTPALGGDYVLTPAMLRGEEPITFAAFGESDPQDPLGSPARPPAPLTEEQLSGL